MIQITRKSTLTTTVAALLLICSFQSLSVYANDAQKKNPGEDSQHNETISSFVIARSKIESAIDSYNNGDMARSKKDLDVAIEWLNKASQSSKTEKSIKETKILSAEIDKLKEQLNQSTLENERSLMHFSHKTMTIIEREVDQLIHGYINLSTAEKTLKHLLDAKMHLSYANRNLLVGHEINDSAAELDKVIDYLDEAGKVATKPIQNRIEHLKKDISSLKDKVIRSKNAWKSNDEIILLSEAIDSLNKAKKVAQPNIKTQIASIIFELYSLLKDIESTSINKSYDSCMATLKNIISEL